MTGMRLQKANTLLFLLGLLVPAAGCGGGLAAIGTTVAGAALPVARGEETEAARLGQVSGVLVEVDELQTRIRLTTDDGRTGSLVYDSDTIVMFQQEHHPIDLLRAGDRIVVQTRQEGSGPVRAVRIDVHRESSEPNDPPPAPPQTVPVPPPADPALPPDAR